MSLLNRNNENGAQIESPPPSDISESGLNAIENRVTRSLSAGSNGSPVNQQPYYLSLEKTLAVMEKALHDDVLESTTNLDDNEIEKLSNAMILYYYTRNKALLVKMMSFMKMKRSYTQQPKNVLESLFELPKRFVDNTNEQNGIMGILGRRFGR